jgi:hypothetical protein
LVEREIGIGLAGGGILPRLAMVEIAPLVKQIRPKTAAADRLQELLGDDGVGVDIVAIHRRDKPFVNDEFFHGVFPRRPRFGGYFDLSAALVMAWPPALRS